MTQTRGNIQPIERRKHWRDRRNGIDRRCVARSQHALFDCRNGVPRRRADVEGEQCDGEIWWAQSAT